MKRILQVWKSILLFSLFILTILYSSPSNISAQLSGVVFEDISMNGAAINTYGSKDVNEAGVAGVTVTVYPSGLNTTTDANGLWSIAAVPAGDVRIEFSAWPTYLQASTDAGGSNTSVQFVTAPNAAVNYGLHDPSQDFVRGI